MKKSSLLLGFGAAASLLVTPMLSSGCRTTHHRDGASSEKSCGCKEGHCGNKGEGKCGCKMKDGKCGEGGCGEGGCGGEKKPEKPEQK